MGRRPIPLSVVAYVVWRHDQESQSCCLRRYCSLTPQIHGVVISKKTALYLVPAIEKFKPLAENICFLCVFPVLLRIDTQLLKGFWGKKRDTIKTWKLPVYSEFPFDRMRKRWEEPLRTHRRLQKKGILSSGVILLVGFIVWLSSLKECRLLFWLRRTADYRAINIRVLLEIFWMRKCGWEKERK